MEVQAATMTAAPPVQGQARPSSRRRYVEEEGATTASAVGAVGSTPGASELGSSRKTGESVGGSVASNSASLHAGISSRNDT